MAPNATAPSTPAAEAAAARLAGMSPPRPAEAPAAPAAPASRKEQRAAKKAAKGGAKKKLPIKPILGVVLLLLVGYVVKGKVIKPHYGPGQKVPNGQIVAIDQVTTNLADGHLAQVTVELQLTKPGSTKLVTLDDPELVNSVVTDLGQDTYGQLLAPAGRAALKLELLHQFQQILGPAEGAQQVSAIYFTGFVLQ